MWQQLVRAWDGSNFFFVQALRDGYTDGRFTAYVSD